jgi:hypothetical protein
MKNTMLKNSCKSTEKSPTHMANYFFIALGRFEAHNTEPAMRGAMFHCVALLPHQFFRVMIDQRIDHVPVYTLQDDISPLAFEAAHYISMYRFAKILSNAQAQPADND